MTDFREEFLEGVSVISFGWDEDVLSFPVLYSGKCIYIYIYGWAGDRYISMMKTKRARYNSWFRHGPRRSSRGSQEYLWCGSALRLAGFYLYLVARSSLVQ